MYFLLWYLGSGHVFERIARNENDIFFRIRNRDSQIANHNEKQQQ